MSDFQLVAAVALMSCLAGVVIYCVLILCDGGTQSVDNDEWGYKAFVVVMTVVAWPLVVPFAVTMWINERRQR